MIIIISKIKLSAQVRSKIGKINFTFRSFLLFDQATQISSLIRVSKFQVPSFGNGCRVPRRSRNPRQRHQTRISTIKFLPWTRSIIHGCRRVIKRPLRIVDTANVLTSRQIGEIVCSTRINLTAINGPLRSYFRAHADCAPPPSTRFVSSRWWRVNEFRGRSSLTGNFDSDSKLSNEWTNRFLTQS